VKPPTRLSLELGGSADEGFFGSEYVGPVLVPEEGIVSDTKKPEKTVTNGPSKKRRVLLTRMAVDDRQVSLAGISTALIETGEGPPMVLLHGPGEFAGTWMRVIPELAKSHRVIAPDLPGHGESGLPMSGLDADRVLRWLDELISDACGQPPILVGHLLGGALAARFAASHSEKLAALVLVDTYGLAKLWPNPKFAFALAKFIIRPTVATQRAMMDRCMVDLAGLRDEMNGDLDMLEAYALEWAQKPKAKAALRGLMSTHGIPAIGESELKAITIPTTLIWGRDDLQVPVRVAERASRHYGWPLHIIEQCADDPAVEQPADFLSALRRSIG